MTDGCNLAVWLIFQANDFSWYSALKGTFCQPRAMPWGPGNDLGFRRVSTVPSRPFYSDDGHTHYRPFRRPQGMALG